MFPERLEIEEDCEIELPSRRTGKMLTKIDDYDCAFFLQKDEDGNTEILRSLVIGLVKLGKPLELSEILMALQKTWHDHLEVEIEPHSEMNIGEEGNWAEDRPYVHNFIEVIGNIHENSNLLKYYSII